MSLGPWLLQANWLNIISLDGSVRVALSGKKEITDNQSLIFRDVFADNFPISTPQSNNSRWDCCSSRISTSCRSRLSLCLFKTRCYSTTVKYICCKYPKLGTMYLKMECTDGVPWAISYGATWSTLLMVLHCHILVQLLTTHPVLQAMTAVPATWSMGVFFQMWKVKLPKRNVPWEENADMPRCSQAHQRRTNGSKQLKRNDWRVRSRRGQEIPNNPHHRMLLMNSRNARHYVASILANVEEGAL